MGDVTIVHAEGCAMAPEYLAPGVYVEEVSLRAPTKADLAFGTGRGDQVPVEAGGEPLAPATGKDIPREVGIELEAAEAPDLAADTIAEFNGGHPEEGVFTVAADGDDAERAFEGPGRDLSGTTAAFDEGGDTAFDA
jgi:hypothetical protein